MAVCEVEHVDVIALAGAVRGGIVVAVDAELRAAADGDLLDERHEVVGDALGVLADAAAGMRADRVEVAEEDHLPAGVRVLKIGEHVLDEELGAAVGVEGGGGEILGARDGGGLAVDGGGRRR